MNQMQKMFFAAVALLSAAPALAASCPPATANGCGATPHFNMRSTQYNVAREMVGWEDLINLCDNDCWYGAFAVTFEYDQTFRPGCIARSLFGNDIVSSTVTNGTVTTGSTLGNCCDNNGCGNDCNSDCGGTIIVSGSRFDGRGANDWLADYFGLPTDFRSAITFKPRIRNFTTDIAFYLGLDEWACGLYFRLDLPITHTRWDLNFCERVLNAGENDYAPGYFTSTTVAREDLLSQATDFFSGRVPTLGDDVTFNPLTCSKWATSDCNCKGLNQTRLAAVIGVLGWNFVCCEDYHFGLNIRAAAPTGCRPSDEFLFAPIVGNGHHWELGGGVSAHATLWRCDESDSSFSVYLEGNVTHLFNSCQRRVFDLCGKPNSRYALAQRLEAATNGLAGVPTEGDFTPATDSNFQFANEFSPVANLTCRQVDVSVAVQGDIAIKFEYATGCGFVWDLGYEFWGRSCEKFCRRNNNCVTSPLTDGTTWALKGDAHVVGFNATSEDAVALAATQSGSNIHGGCNGFSSDATENLDAIRNPGIDNAQFAIVGTNLVVATPGGANQTRTSIQPVFITDSLIDFSGTKAVAHKLFTHFNYEWRDCEDWVPFLGVGASVEFSGNNNCCNNDCNTSCCGVTGTTTTTNLSNFNCCNDSCGTSGSNTSCRSIGVNQWGVWVKGGVAFN